MRPQTYVELIYWVPISNKPWLHTNACYTLTGPEAVIPEKETSNTRAKRKPLVLWNTRKAVHSLGPATWGSQELRTSRLYNHFQSVLAGIALFFCNAKSVGSESSESFCLRFKSFLVWLPEKVLHSCAVFVFRLPPFITFDGVCLFATDLIDSCSEVLTLTFYKLRENRQKIVRKIGKVRSFYEIIWKKYTNSWPTRFPSGPSLLSLF